MFSQRIFVVLLNMEWQSLQRLRRTDILGLQGCLAAQLLSHSQRMQPS